MPQGILSWKRLQFTIFDFVLANEEPRGAWKTLSECRAEFGFGGGNSLVSALRADPDLSVSLDFNFLRRIGDSNS